MPFDGKTYESEQDSQRLGSLLSRVFGLMVDHEWRTLFDIHENTGGTEASVSARLRDLRKQKFGAHEIGRRRVEEGLWEYQVSCCHGHATCGANSRRDSQ